MIYTPNPITTTGQFTGAWLTNVRISIGVGGVVSHVRFNGTHILEESPITKPFMEPLTSIETIITAEALRLTGKTDIVLVTVFAPSPTKPIKITFIFADKSRFEIADAYALAETDQVFSAAFTEVMTTIGTLINQQV